MASPMKTDLIKLTAQSIKNPRGILAGLITTLIFLNVLPKVWSQSLPPLFWAGNIANPATAGGGTWTTATTSGPSSWSSSSTSFVSTPWTNSSVAHFLGSGGGTVTLGSAITAAGINFDSGASSFDIETNRNALTIQGGIVNNSGTTQ